MNAGDADLVQRCADAAGKLLNTDYKSALPDVIQRNLIGGCLAHGCFMGYKRALKHYTKGIRSMMGLLPKPPMDSDDLDEWGGDAAEFYLSKKLRGAGQEKRALVRVLVSRGVKIGVRMFEAEIAGGAKESANNTGSRADLPPAQVPQA